MNCNGDNIKKSRDGVVGFHSGQTGCIIDRHYDRINLAGIIQALRSVYCVLWLISRPSLLTLLDKKVNLDQILINFGEQCVVFVRSVQVVVSVCA